MYIKIHHVGTNCFWLCSSRLTPTGYCAFWRFSPEQWKAWAMVFCALSTLFWWRQLCPWLAWWSGQIRQLCCCGRRWLWWKMGTKELEPASQWCCLRADSCSRRRASLLLVVWYLVTKMQLQSLYINSISDQHKWNIDDRFSLQLLLDSADRGYYFASFG